MRDVDKFKEAERRCNTGDVQGGLQIHLDICINGQDERVRLQSALLLVERLGVMDHLPKLLQACDVGIGCARRIRDLASEAYLTGKKAEYLAVLNGVSLVAARKALRMAPGWFAFSLERDEAQFKELTAKIDANEGEVGRLLERALLLSEDANSHSAKAQVLQCEAKVYFHRYMNLKMEYLKGTGKVPMILIRFLSPYRLDEFFLFKREERANMERCLEQCEASYLAAVEEFRKENDEAATAYAYYNLANELRSAFRFHKAKKYLRLAKRITERHDERRLLPGIKALEKSIRARNRDTPNYLAGERREIPQ